MPPASGPSWRGPTGKPATGGARSWRRPGIGSSTTWNPRSRWLQTLLSALTVLVALAAIIMFIVLVFVPGCNHTDFAVLAPAPYTDPGMPPQPFAKRDADEFRDSFVADSFLPSLESSKRVDGSTSSKKKSAPSRKVRLVYVTAMAGLTPDGVVLYRTESGPDDIESGLNEPNACLPLERLWKVLADFPADQKKILVIDLACGPIDWRWGQFVRPRLGSESNKGDSIGDVGEALSRIPNLAILTSGAPGEASWSSPILKQSAFAHFLMRALAGEADGSGGHGRDRRVTLDELHNFVLTHTNHWVAQNRDPRGQHPQLLTLPESRDGLMNVVVAEVRGKVAPPSIDRSKSIEGTQLKKLEELWAARDEWSKNEAEQWHPLAWRQVLESLRRAEQWWLAGQPVGMNPHLYGAEKAVQNLKLRYEIRNRFLATPLARRTDSGTFSNGELDTPEHQLSQALETFAPNSIAKSDRVHSVSLRTLAEQQSWHSFRSRLWTGEILSEIDRDRRYAEDLLFIGGQSEIDASSSMRQTVSTKLEQHKQIVVELSDLVRLHHRLLAELPELAWWAAHRLPDEMISKSARESNRFHMMTKFSELIDENKFRPPAVSQQEKALLRDNNDPNDLHAIEVDLLLLFEQTRQLGRLLDRERDISPGAFSASPEWRGERDVVIRSLTDPDRGLAALLRRLTRHADGLIGSFDAEKSGVSGPERGQTQHYHWLRLRNALQWSGLPAKTRHGLFAALEESDRTLSANTQKAPVATSAEWNGDDWSSVDGCWQALWSLQTLSLGMPYTAMDQRWVDWKNAWQDSKKQDRQLAELGHSVRKEFRDRQKLANRTPNDSDQLDDALRTLLVAERATRTLHGYDAVLFNVDHDPIRQLQEFDLGALCIAQAERYLDDFWSNTKGDDPWYVGAVNQCLRAARRQHELVNVRALKTARENVELRLEQRKTARLKIASVDTKLDLSLVNQRPTIVAAAIDNQVPPGAAALWLEEDAEASARILEFSPLGRRAITSKSLSAEITIRKQRPVPETKCEEIRVQPRLLFRARYWNDKDSVIRVDPCRPNSINREYQSPPTTGEIVVRGVDRRDTIFMLDCSLSMNEGIVTKNAPPYRFPEATKALTTILQFLRDTPMRTNEREPHIVGLMAFGHRARAKYAKRSQGTESIINSRWEKRGGEIPEDVRRDWWNDNQLLVKPAALDAEQYRRMNAYLDIDNSSDDNPVLEPWGETPLLGAILDASEFLVSKQHGGVVVAVCDGAYNDEGKNGPKLDRIIQLYKKHRELSLNIVAFGVDKNADKAQLEELAKIANGEFLEAPTAEKLAQAIQAGIAPRKFSVIREAEPRWERLADLGRTIDELPVGKYKIRFQGLNDDFEAKIVGGERLEFDLATANRKLKHRRPPPQLSRRMQGTRATSLNEPTRFGYLKAEYDKLTNRARFQFCLDRDDPSGMVERPREIRIDISPSGSRRQFSGSWKLAPDQSVPTWQVELLDWPADAKPEVGAYWKMTRTEPDIDPLIAEELKETKKVTLEAWPVEVTAVQQAGKVLVKLQATSGNVAEVRVELGEVLPVKNQFEPKEFNWTSELFESERQIIYTFDVGPNFDFSKARIALTSNAALNRDNSQLESPLKIEKWDGEQ